MCCILYENLLDACYLLEDDNVRLLYNGLHFMQYHPTLNPIAHPFLSRGWDMGCVAYVETAIDMVSQWSVVMHPICCYIVRHYKDRRLQCNFFKTKVLNLNLKQRSVCVLNIITVHTIKENSLIYTFVHYVSRFLYFPGEPMYKHLVKNYAFQSLCCVTWITPTPIQRQA